MKKLLIAFSLLLGLASPVAAGCAWILWGTPFDKQGNQSGAVSAMMGYEKRADCIQAAAGYEAKARNSPSDIYWSCTCLPDTINLKNPK